MKLALRCCFNIAFLTGVLLGCAAYAAKPKKSQKTPATSISNADLPPIVFLGTGHLDCTISSKENGRQFLELTGGAGVHFDIEVTPILDGILELKNGRLTGGEKDKAQTAKGERGLNYRFTSHLAKTKIFRVTGFGALELKHLETRVSVNARRYRQDKPGATVSFSSDDMDKQGVYIEFRGIFTEVATNKRFAFRTLLGPPSDGSGRVTPLDSNDSSRIIAKTVMVDIAAKPGAPFTQITTTIRELDEK